MKLINIIGSRRKLALIVTLAGTWSRVVSTRSVRLQVSKKSPSPNRVTRTKFKVINSLKFKVELEDGRAYFILRNTIVI